MSTSTSTSTSTGAGAGAAVEDCFRDEWPVLVATAARICGDVGAAEEVVQEVMVTALARWPYRGVPDRPGAWLMTAVRNRARNHVRDTTRRHGREAAASAWQITDGDPGDGTDPADPSDRQAIDDDRLRLIFVACHPVLSTEAQVALTLRLVGGLSTRQIARAFLQPEATIAQRLVRAKRTLADAHVPFAVPPPDEWPARLPAVLGVVYLVFNEGYTSPDAAALCEEALHLGRLLAELVPEEPDVHGLLALMELHGARLEGRFDGAGDLVLLPDQDRSRWDRSRIAAGTAALRRARGLGVGPLVLQAELAACHVAASSWEATDWGRIVAVYDQLLALSPSPVVALNRAVAVGMLHGPERGLSELAPLVDAGDLDDYHLLWATRADLARRCGSTAAAAADYRRALSLAANPSERRFLAARLAECGIDDAPAG